jgi:hypothetical protein
MASPNSRTSQYDDRDARVPRRCDLWDPGSRSRRLRRPAALPMEQPGIAAVAAGRRGFHVLRRRQLLASTCSEDALGASSVMIAGLTRAGSPPIALSTTCSTIVPKAVPLTRVGDADHVLRRPARASWDGEGAR